MKEYYIYEMHEVLSPIGLPYIGCTYDLHRRSIQHKSKRRLVIKPNLIPILGPFSDRLIAKKIENDLREKNGWLREGAFGGMGGDKESHAIGGSIGGKTSSQIEYVCPYCDQVGRGNSMFRWHFDKCKKKQ